MKLLSTARLRLLQLAYFMVFNLASLTPTKRAARISWKAAAVFALAYGAGAIVALIVNGIVPLYAWLSFLNIGVYGSVTVLAITIGTVFTYPLLVYFNRYFRTTDQ